MTSNSLQGYNFDNFEANFREFLISEKVSPVTLKNYLSDLRHFLGWLSLHQASHIVTERKDSVNGLVSLIDTGTVEAYKTYLVSNRLPDNTVNRRLSTLRKFCSFCIGQGWMKNNPAKGISNTGTGRNHHGHALMQVNVEEDRQDKPEEHVVFSAKQLFEFQQTLAELPVAEAQTVKKDIEEFFVIINSTNVV